jgi:hypothetical protein
MDQDYNWEFKMNLIDEENIYFKNILKTYIFKFNIL